MSNGQDSPFKVGETYPMRGGGTFEVIAIRPELQKSIVGITKHRISNDWLSSRWPNGTVEGLPASAFDLIPPTPPVVVSDAVMLVYLNANNPSASDLWNATAMDVRRPIIADTIAAWLAENPR